MATLFGGAVPVKAGGHFVHASKFRPVFLVFIGILLLAALAAAVILWNSSRKPGMLREQVQPIRLPWNRETVMESQRLGNLIANDIIGFRKATGTWPSSIDEFAKRVGTPVAGDGRWMLRVLSYDDAILSFGDEFATKRGILTVCEKKLNTHDAKGDWTCW